jgi:hypothetical protein
VSLWRSLWRCDEKRMRTEILHENPKSGVVHFPIKKGSRGQLLHSLSLYKAYHCSHTLDLDITTIMGNSAPAPAPEPPIKDDGYKWPENLYTEMRDMAALSFLVYAFAYASDVARKVGGLQGLDLTDSGKIKKSATRDLPRSFTPQEILELLETNREALITHFPSSFEDGPNYDLLVKNLKVLQGTIAYAI